MYLENWYLLRLTGRLLVLVWLAEWQFTVGHINQHWNEFFFCGHNSYISLQCHRSNGCNRSLPAARLRLLNFTTPVGFA